MKTVLSPADAHTLRQTLHVATLEAMMASRRWEPGDLAFQGGCSLHLAHGSPRYSEDLDFLLDKSIDLERIVESTISRLANTAFFLPPGTQLTATKVRAGNNPRSFVVAIGGANLLGSVKVKVECWAVDKHDLMQIKTVVSPMQIRTGPFAGTSTFVPTLAPHELWVDKIIAVAARAYLKPRDIFDLHWLSTHPGVTKVSATDIANRLALYPDQTLGAWVTQATKRTEELQEAKVLLDIAMDLERWLPTGWPLDTHSVGAMCSNARAALADGLAAMHALQHPVPPAPPQAVRRGPVAARTDDSGPTP